MSDLPLFPPLLSSSSEAIAFYRNTVPVSYAMLRADIEVARRALMQLETPEVVLYDSDAYAFFVWLMACWQNGQTALAAPDDLPATHKFLSLPWIGRCKDSVLPDWSGSVADATASADPAPQFECPGLVLFTSGSSGVPSRIFKTREQLCREASILHQLYGGDLPPGTRFVGTVPHHHIFGLGHRVLWPLWAGFSVISELFHYPEELGRLAAVPHVLVSGPSMLKRLAQLDTFSSPASFLAAFSAGSPLQDDVAIACGSRLATRMIDVYGSTEIGSVMHRVVPGGIWRGHPGSTLALDEHGCVKIRTPLAADDNWFYTQDCAILDDGGLHLLGRADRIAKIEGRRIALEAVEKALLTLSEVKEARCAPVYGERDEIVAAVVLSETGHAQLRELGKTRFDRWMRQRLSSSLERIALPRRWRYVSALPYNAMGKITTASVVQLLERQALPPFVVATRAAHEGEMVLTLPLRNCMQAFDGHFPQVAILAGIIQVDWALRLAQRYFPIEGQFSGLRQLRFQRILRPDDEVSLTLRFAPEKKEVSFTYASAHGVHSQGQASFAAAPDTAS